MYWFIRETITESKKQQSIDPKIANDLVGEEPYCPECQSYNIWLVDPNSNLVWLKGLIPELNYYECLKCGYVFSDEE